MAKVHEAGTTSPEDQIRKGPWDEVDLTRANGKPRVRVIRRIKVKGKHKVKDLDQGAEEVGN
jgi:hypothetical protein